MHCVSVSAVHGVHLIGLCLVSCSGSLEFDNTSQAFVLEQQWRAGLSKPIGSTWEEVIFFVQSVRLQCII